MTTTLDSLRALVIDVDVVLWRGNHTLPGVVPFFDFLNARQIKFIIATNNSARPASDIIERLTAMNVKIDETQVLTSAQATALYLPHILLPGSRVFVIGGEGLKDAITRAGYELADENVDAVVAGVDWALTYEKLKRATLEIRRGAKFIGTNPDKTYPMNEGIVPGAGAIQAAIQAATDVAPLVIGKPERAMFDIAVEKMNAPRGSVEMIGDRIDTDIHGAQRAGLKTILVLTGVTTRESLAHESPQPDFVFDDLDMLRRAWADHFL